MILISYGITKSGSTLAFELARRIAIQAGFKQRRLPDRVVSPAHAKNFIVNWSPETIGLLLGEIAADEYIVVKTHARPSDSVIRRLGQADCKQQIRIHAVFRDPREIALSLVDAGDNARSRNLVSFAEVGNLEDAKSAVRRQIPNWRQFMSVEGALPLYYDDVAFDTVATVRQMARHMGIPCNPHTVACHVLRDRKTQYNKGVKGRWNELSDADAASFKTEFADMYRFIRKHKVRTGMRRLASAVIGAERG